MRFMMWVGSIGGICNLLSIAASLAADIVSASVSGLLPALAGLKQGKQLKRTIRRKERGLRFLGVGRRLCLGGIERSRVSIRAVWAPDVPDGKLIDEKSLLFLERASKADKTAFQEIDEALEGYASWAEVLPLIKSAQSDLVAGCELARAGYLKQAYTLWRSWYEQELFALYFLESPIHSKAWSVSESVSLTDSPKVRLMLHQLLAESGEPHPFAIVYGTRFDVITSQLRASLARDRRLIKRAGRVLTQLSQGVHGTFRPNVPSKAVAQDRLKQDGIPTLTEALRVTTAFWCCYLVDKLGLDEATLLSLRVGEFAATTHTDQEIGNKLLKLNAPFSRSFEGL